MQNALLEHSAKLWPALSDNQYWKSILGLILSGRLRQVWLYNSSLSSFVPNFRILCQVVAEKYFTEKCKYVFYRNDRRKNWRFEKRRQHEYHHLNFHLHYTLCLQPVSHIRVNRTYNRTNRGLIRVTLGPFECIRESRVWFLKLLKKLTRVPCPCLIVLAIVYDRERPCETLRGRLIEYIRALFVHTRATFESNRTNSPPGTVGGQ